MVIIARRKRIETVLAIKSAVIAGLDDAGCC